LKEVVDIFKVLLSILIIINYSEAQTQDAIGAELERLNGLIQGEWVLTYDIPDYEKYGYDIGVADSTFTLKFEGNYRFHYYNNELFEEETAPFRIYYGECDDLEESNNYFIEYCYDGHGCYCLSIRITQDGNKLFIQSDFGKRRGLESLYLRKEYYFDKYIKNKDD